MNLYFSTIGSEIDGNQQNKNISIWDAIRLYDVESFNKEQQSKILAKRNNQKQLKEYLDKQISERRNKSIVDRNNDANEYQLMENNIRTVGAVRYHSN